jgi:hypothetical protein
MRRLDPSDVVPLCPDCKYVDWCDICGSICWCSEEEIEERFVTEKDILLIESGENLKWFYECRVV